MSVLTENIDSRPYTGKRSVIEKLRISNADYLNDFFNGAENVEQIKAVTRGKTYDIVAIEGFGDAEDVTFIDDKGNEQTLGDFFFEELI